jgi:hypothetical protein
LALTLRERLESLGNEQAASNANTYSAKEKIEATEAHIKRCSTKVERGECHYHDGAATAGSARRPCATSRGNFGRCVTMNDVCLTLDLFSETDLELRKILAQLEPCIEASKVSKAKIVERLVVYLDLDLDSDTQE